MNGNKALGFLASFVLVFVLGSSGANAQSQPCLDFRSFPSTTPLQSPVVAPSGATIPSDIHVSYTDNDPNSNNPNPDPNIDVHEEYYFERSFVKDYDEQLKEMTALTSQYYGEFKVTFDNPVNNGLVIFTVMHINQPDIEYRFYDSNGVEITSGWTATNEYPNFDPSNPDPEEREIYSFIIQDYFNPLRPIKTMVMRNLTGKSYLFEYCVH